MKPSTAYEIAALVFGMVTAAAVFEVGPIDALSQPGTVFMAMVVCAATATILREMGR